MSTRIQARAEDLTGLQATEKTIGAELVVINKHCRRVLGTVTTKHRPSRLWCVTLGDDTPYDN